MTHRESSGHTFYTSRTQPLYTTLRTADRKKTADRRARRSRARVSIAIAIVCAVHVEPSFHIPGDAHRQSSLIATVVRSVVRACAYCVLFRCVCWLSGAADQSRVRVCVCLAIRSDASRRVSVRMCGVSEYSKYFACECRDLLRIF